MISYTNTKINNFRMGYLLMDSGDRMSFRFNKLTRKDVQTVEVLTNVEYGQESFFIRVISPIEFKPNQKIVIDNVKYRINSLYSEDLETNDGNIVKVNRKIQYLQLVK